MIYELRVAPLAKEQILEILGDRLPDCITQANFTPDGFVQAADGKLLVPVYLASAEGFKPDGLALLQNVVKPELEKAGCHVLDPWAACNGYDVSTPKKLKSIVDTVCYEVLMPRSKLLVARLSGDEVDPGVAAEIVIMANLFGPVIGIMEKAPERKHESGLPINIMLNRFMSRRYGGKLFIGEQANADALAYIGKKTQEMVKARGQ